MENKYKFGKEVEYSELTIIKPEDKNKLQAFCCGNDILDHYIHEEIFEDKDAQGLHFIVTDKKTGDVICFVSLTTSGIIFREGSYTEVLPSIKIDVFAVDVQYQKMHFDEESFQSDEHFYLSDDIMCAVIRHCREIDENYAMVNYILLYADKKAERFYERNGYGHFCEFMEQEHKMEINENIPMYLEL